MNLFELLLAVCVLDVVPHVKIGHLCRFSWADPELVNNSEEKKLGPLLRRQGPLLVLLRL